MKILTVDAVSKLLKQHGFEQYLHDLMHALKRDFGRWEEFVKTPRPSIHVPDGIVELMPICDDTYYTFKYVNSHPKNPLTNKMTVVATGQLVRVDTGYPVLFTEMTVLTAMRTAAMSAVATDYMARRDARVLALIGTGAQSEFQARAAQLVRPITTIRYYDIDPKAMEKFARNMAGCGMELVPCRSAKEATVGADIITVCTACKQHVDVIKDAWIQPGVHINALGGDCPGKTELEVGILQRSRIVVEYFDQSSVEGEIQRFSRSEAKNKVHAEIYELVRGTKQGRENDGDITVFDSVGIALEDYSTLRLAYELIQKYKLGEDRDFIPVLGDPKDLVSYI